MNKLELIVILVLSLTIFVIGGLAGYQIDPKVQTSAFFDYKLIDLLKIFITILMGTFVSYVCIINSSIRNKSFEMKLELINESKSIIYLLLELFSDTKASTGTERNKKHLLHLRRLKNKIDGLEKLIVKEDICQKVLDKYSSLKELITGDDFTYEGIESFSREKVNKITLECSNLETQLDVLLTDLIKDY